MTARRRDDRRLLGFVAGSLLLHALLIARWPLDAGQRPAQAPPALTARLAPGAIEQPQPPELAMDVLASSEPSSLVPVPAGGVPQASAPQVETPAPGAPSPAFGHATRFEPLAESTQLERAPKTGAEQPGGADLTWYGARELDLLPRPLAPIEPPVPALARARGVSGKVTLQVSIDATGRVVAVDVVRGDPPGVFEDAASAAFRAARYAPGIKDGRAVRARVQTVVVFELDPLQP